MNLTAANTHDWSAVQAAGYQLWLAQYPSGARQGYGPQHATGNARGWETVMWQYTQQGRLDGYAADLDLNIFYGSRADWLKLAAGNKVAPNRKRPPKPKPARGNTHRVKAGDSLSLIAARYHTTVKAISMANKIANRNLIQAGQTLVIPPTGSTAAPPTPRTYTVRQGDTLDEIAAKHRTTWQILRRLNRLPDANHIKPGQRLRLPQ